MAESQGALVSIPDGALAVDDTGSIVYCGPFAELSAQYSDWIRSDHRPGFLLPGFVDTHVHFPQTYSGDAYGGGQLLEWLNALFAETQRRGLRIVSGRGIRPSGRSRRPR